MALSRVRGFGEAPAKAFPGPVWGRASRSRALGRRDISGARSGGPGSSFQELCILLELGKKGKRTTFWRARLPPEGRTPCPEAQERPRACRPEGRCLREAHPAAIVVASTL